MGLVKPEITQLLRSAGISRGGIRAVTDGDASISDRLANAGLSIEECFDELRGIITNGDSDTVKLNGIKMVLEAHKVMKGDSVVGTTVNIIINDSSETINPMFLPRQLIAIQQGT
jgi:uncharacterized Zn-binding protein involved in type VI secretion